MTLSSVNAIGVAHEEPGCADKKKGSNRYAGSMILAYFMDLDLQKIT